MKKLFIIMILCIGLFACSKPPCSKQSFCEMSEKCRLEVCPAQRAVSIVGIGPDGDSMVVEYQCNQDGTYGYVETVDFSKSVQKSFDREVKMSALFLEIKKVCDTKHGSVYSYRNK